ncbi:MAG: hypothetical protein M3A44_11310 [Gammaproteobacteria bacterium]
MYTHAPKIFSVAAILSALLSPAHAAVTLDPLQTGLYTNGDGVMSRWVQMTEAWNGQWGIEQLADQKVVMDLPASSSDILRTLETKVSTINFSDDVYREKWANTDEWKQFVTQPVPLFSPTDSNQNDYAARFTGYVAITTPGEYNFGVLSDEGFKFTLTGANGSHSSQLDGLNPRELVGFDSNIAMQAGVYQFTLDTYEHTQAGVISLNWWHGPGASEFGLIPQSSLFSAIPPVPEPEEWLLFAAGLLTLACYFRKNQPAASPAAEA